MTVRYTELAISFFIFILLFVPRVSGAVFNPDARWSCTDTAVSVFVRTETPFQGLIKTRGSTAEGCSVKGIDTNLAVLKINFNRTDCGMIYDKDEDTYSVTVDIHSHPILIIDTDQSLNLICRNSHLNSTEQSRTESSIYLLQVYDKENTLLKKTHYASPYNVRVSSFDRSKDFSIGRCSASVPLKNESVQLTDYRGCSVVPSLFADFIRGPSGMTSSFPSMFRFPSSSEITISCEIIPCDGTCEDFDCRTSNSLNEIPKILEETTSSELDSDYEVVSTTITVIEKLPFTGPILNEVADDSPDLSSTASSQLPTEPVNMLSPTSSASHSVPTTLVHSQPELEECVRPSDVDLMYALCIFLTVCSTIGFSINIIFGCLLWRNRRKRNKEKSPRSPKPTAASAPADFWIIESNKLSEPEPKYYEAARTVDSFASVKKKPRRAQIPIMEYGMSPASRNSDGSSTYGGSGRGLTIGGDTYKRQDIPHSQSTFMTPSTTMETDLDSSVSSNQASSYH